MGKFLYFSLYLTKMKKIRGQRSIILWFVIVLLHCMTIHLHAQTRPLKKVGTTRAVVVGISEYKHPEIPSLQYADKDASVFASFLKSPGGGDLSDHQIRLLLNQHATAANFERELQWLYDDSKEGDRVIIFFSGHGDVERRMGNEGFLLCHDAAPRLYQSTGGFMIYSFKRMIETLINEKKLDIILIIDACRAGTLSGSSIGGPQITAQNIRNLVESNVKIMSCQANEKSLESKQYGGGRGLFSYFLIMGLAGHADYDEDGVVFAKELRQYVENNVSKAADPIRQHPILEADATYPLFYVETNTKENFSDKFSQTFEILTSFHAKSFDNEILQGQDTSLQRLYASFLKAIERKDYIGQSDTCADYFYNQMIADPHVPDEIIRYLKRHYAAELQNDAQEGLLQFMKEDLSSGPFNKEMKDAFANYPNLVERAAAILGEHHSNYRTLMSRAAFFRGFKAYHELPSGIDPVLAKDALSFFHDGIKWDNHSPLVHYYLALTYLNKVGSIDSALYYLNLASMHAQTWVLPHAHIAADLARRHKRADLALQILEEAKKIDEDSPLIWLSYAIVYNSKREYAKAEEAMKMVVAIDPSNCLNQANLAASIMKPSRFDEVKSIFAASEKFCLNDNAFWHYVRGCFYLGQSVRTEALSDFLKAHELNPSHTATVDSLAQWYQKDNQLVNALHYAEVLTKLKPKDADVHYKLAEIHCKMDNSSLCADCLLSSLNLSPTYWERIKHNVIFQSVLSDPKLSEFEKSPK